MDTKQSKRRARIAEETVGICAGGSFFAGGQRQILPVEACVSRSKLFFPEDLECLRRNALPRAAGERASVGVSNETTLSAARAMHDHGSRRVGALNFASAKTPGGGFLRGATAQEEDLALHSALHASLKQFQAEYYDYHRAGGSPLYSHRMILSPECPVFRDEATSNLTEPWPVTFITAAAPNLGALASAESDEVDRVPQILAERAEYVLALAVHAGIKDLVLGAWGCGVFKNDPQSVAEIFARLIPDYRGHFDRIQFAVLDRSPAQKVFKIFHAVMRSRFR